MEGKGAFELRKELGRQVAEHSPCSLALGEVKTSEDFLNAIDFKVLNEVFDSLVAKSGIDHDHSVHEKWVGRESIRFFSGASTSTNEKKVIGGSFNPHRKDLSIFWDSLKGREHGVAYEALKVLVHEVAHARSYAMNTNVDAHYDSWKGEIRNAQSIKELDAIDKKRKETVFSNYSGLERQKSADGKSEEKIGTLLNEAVTEKIAIEVFSEYLRRVGQSRLPASNIPEISETATTSYVFARFLLEITIDALATSLQTDRDIIWRGFVRAYMSGETGPVELIARIGHELGDVPERGLSIELLHSEELPLSSETIMSLRVISATAVKRAMLGLSPEYLTDALKLR